MYKLLTSVSGNFSYTTCYLQGLITTGVTNPRGIAVYPEKGLLAYSNWDDDFDNHPHIGLRYAFAIQSIGFDSYF